MCFDNRKVKRLRTCIACNCETSYQSLVNIFKQFVSETVMVCCRYAGHSIVFDSSIHFIKHEEQTRDEHCVS